METFASIIGASNLLSSRAAEPMVFVTVGAQASGKAKATDAVLPSFGLRRSDLVAVQVDEVVSRLPGYQQDVAAAAHLRTPEDRLQAVQSAYRNARRTTADNISDLILQLALVQKKHIVWETTLANTHWPSLMARQFMRQGYTVVVVYPIVNRQEQAQRARRRMDQTGQAADISNIESQALAVPYHVRAILPYVDQVFVVDNSGTSQSIILHVVRKPIEVTDADGPVETVSADYRCTCGNWRRSRHRLDPELQGALHRYLFEACSTQCTRRKRRAVSPE
jgi:predicted ABC-type ATPase